MWKIVGMVKLDEYLLNNSDANSDFCIQSNVESKNYDSANSTT